MIAVDFFCGAGGLTRGLLNAGIDVVLGVDIDEGCQETYELNNRPAHFLHADLNTLSVREVTNFVDGVDRDNLLLAGCAPCQPFAQLNRATTRDNTARLLGQFSRFIEALEPGQVFIENVPGLVKVPGYSSYKRFCNLLERLGYSYCEGVLDAKRYGVPQTRRRFVLIAVKDTQATLPAPTHGPGRLPYLKVEEAIRGYPPIAAGEIDPTIPNHRAARLSPLNLTRLQHTPHDGGDRRQWPENLWLECHRGKTGYEDVYGRMYWQQPAPTLTGRCHSISNGRYGHPEQDRAISLREAAKLQSFDDTYIFYGTKLTHMARQIGNAVPVRLAEAVGHHILSLRDNLAEAAM